jgi:hypothetical protein
MSRRRRALPLLPAALVLLALLAAGPAGASTGVSIDVGRIAVSEVLAPGGEYRLPAFGVRNPGTEATSYRITVSYLDGQEGTRPPAEWFTFTPAELTLEPGQSRPVQTRLVVPPDADEGPYAALIGPQIVTVGGGAQVGAAAAARLTFTVGPCEGLECWLRWFGRFLEENPWLLVLPAAGVAAGATWLFRQRFSISISRRD